MSSIYYSRDHLLVGDTQVKPGVPVDHIIALAKMIEEKKPAVIVHAGDHWDMPSLSSYDEGKKCMEGRRIEEDIEAGNEAMELFDDIVDNVPDYTPEKIFLLGNHEERIDRFTEENPKFEDLIGINDLSLDSWNVIPYLNIINVDGIRYCHYFANPFTGRAIGGGVVNKMNKLKFSFAQGHIQKFEYHKEYLNDGGILNGLVCGAFYMHNETYKGAQGNHHFRGVVLLKGVKDGDYNIETFDIDSLLAQYPV